MQALRYLITTLSPLIISSKTGDPNIVSTFDHISGSAIHGLFANEYLRINQLLGRGDTDERFNEWFNRGALKFLNAYPADIDTFTSRQYFPLPLAFQREKYGIRVFNLFFNQNHDQEIPETKTIETYGAIENNTIYTKSVRKSLNFHHKRDPLRGTSEEGLIFNYESIDSNQHFVGLILGNKSTLIEFKQIFRDGQYRIGRSRHTQYGLVEFKYLSDEPEDFKSEIQAIDFDDDELILYLISDAVVLNKFGFSTVDLQNFEAVVGLKVKKSIIRASTEEGYRSVWKTKTPSYICFKAGSSFLIELNSQAHQKIIEILLNGIGEFTNLGFGRVMVISNQNDIYYLSQTQPKSNTIIEKPKTVSETAKKLISYVIENALVEKIQNEAITRANQFSKGSYPPSSLISKLIEATSHGKLKEKLIQIEDKSSKAKLEKLNDGEQTLYDFLLAYKVNLEHVLKNITGLRTIRDDLPFEILSQDLEQILEKKFFLTFLTVLRARIKGGESYA